MSAFGGKADIGASPVGGAFCHTVRHPARVRFSPYIGEMTGRGGE